MSLAAIALLYAILVDNSTQHVRCSRLLVSHWIPVSGGKLIDSAV